MQDPTIYSLKPPQFPDQEHLKCPRCDSANTKFCYYNNYNLSQPRHFCKNCRRYWTKGGALRNIPVGGGTRKSNKRSSSKRSSSATITTTTSVSSSPPQPQPPPLQMPTTTSPPPPQPPVLSSSPVTSTTPPTTVQVEAKGEPFAVPEFGNYGSILSSGEGPYGHFYDGSDLQLYGSADPGAGHPGINSEGFLNGHHQSNNGEAGIWNGTNGWPDLAIYTPGSNFQ